MLNDDLVRNIMYRLCCKFSSLSSGERIFKISYDLKVPVRFFGGFLFIRMQHSVFSVDNIIMPCYSSIQFVNEPGHTSLYRKMCLLVHFFLCV